MDSAEAQDGVVIKTASIDRLAAANSTIVIEDNNDTAAYGDYLVTLVTNHRPPFPGEPCRQLIDPEDPGPPPPCLVPEILLVVYDTSTEPYTTVGYKAYSTSGSSFPSAVEFVALDLDPDAPPLVAVLEDCQLAFYNLACEEVYLTELPDSFDHNGPGAFLDAYLDNCSEM